MVEFHVSLGIRKKSCPSEITRSTNNMIIAARVKSWLRAIEANYLA